MPEKPPIRKPDFVVDESDLGMTGDIPADVTPELIREIPKQDDATHFSVSIKTKGVIPTGISATLKGTF